MCGKKQADNTSNRRGRGRKGVITLVSIGAVTAIAGAIKFIVPRVKQMSAGKASRTGIHS
jgi:hypothetical protein